MYSINKNIILIILILGIYSNLYSQTCNKFKVIELDSTKNNYIITVKSQDIKSVIISSKSNSYSGRKIKIGKKYKLKLSEITIFKRLTYDIKHSITIDQKVVWKNDDDFRVYTTKDLIGLYYRRNKKKKKNSGSN